MEIFIQWALSTVKVLLIMLISLIYFRLLAHVITIGILTGIETIKEANNGIKETG